MPESPGSEGRRGPPPIPGLGTAGPGDAPAAPHLQVQAQAPAPGCLDLDSLEELAGLVAREAEKLQGGARSDLCVRVALLFWDVLDDPEAARRYMDMAEPDHPVAARLLLAQALSEGDYEGLSRAEDAIRSAQVPDAVRGALLQEVAEAWLYRLGDARRSADTLQAAGKLVEKSAGSGIRDVLPVALALAGDWVELAAYLKDEVGGSDAASEAAHVLCDRLGDDHGAASLLEKLPMGERNLHGLELLTELSSQSSPPLGLELPTVIRRKLEALAHVAEATLERLSLTFLLAEHLERSGEIAEAAPLLAQLSSASSPGWGPRLAMRVRLRIAIERSSWQEVAATCRELARDAGHPPLSRACLRRAAEILDARAGDEARALELYSELWRDEHAEPSVLHALERLRLCRGEHAELVSLLASATKEKGVQRPAMLRRAAALAETRLGELEAAIRLRRDALLGADDACGHEDLVRLFRRQRDRVHLAQAYRKLAQLADSDAVTGTWLCAAGALELALGHGREAEDAFREAARRVPTDVFARVALANMYRKSARHRELAEALRALSTLIAHDGLRVTVLRELGRITAVKLGDPKGARVHLTRALELAPDDAGVMHALAELCGEAGDFAQAVQLRERAVELAGRSAHAASMLLEIGEIQERHLRDEEAARHAYERALSIDDASLDALRALAQLHRKGKRSAELLSVLRQKLELTTASPLRLTLLLEIARLAEQAEGDMAAAVEASRAALAIEPANESALATVERACRRDGLWEILAEVLASAPRTMRNVRVLGEVLDKLERWSELADIRRVELELAEEPKDALRLALSLAHLHEQKLKDVEGAVRFLGRAHEIEPTDARPLSTLARLLEGTGRWTDLVDVYERQLLLASRSEKGALLMRIGEIRRDRLDRWVEAAHAFEGVLELEDQGPAALRALGALEQIYTRLARHADLLRVLEKKAAAEADPVSRAQLYTQIAEIRETRGDPDGALEMLRRSFHADPSNRNTFTTLERLCYKREKWREVMELYDAATALVESGQSRAYRLADLQARRGQVQLQYLSQPGEAAASYLRVIELDPDNDTALRFLESIFSQQGDWLGLIRAYEKRAELTADDERRIETFRRAARVASAKSKDMPEAARLYERVLGVDPADPEALEALERFYEKAREWEKLLAVLTTRLASAGSGEPAVSLLLRMAQICEDGLRDENRAIEHYRRVLSLVPSNKEAMDALGRIHESTEKWTDFIDVTRRQIRITTDRNLKALLYFKCGSVMESKFGKEEDAIRYYDAAIKTSPSCLPAVHGLRDLYLRRRDFARVLQTLELEVKLWQDDKERAGVFAQIGQIYGEHLGDPEHALQYYESALAVDPESLPANKALFELYFTQRDWARAAPLAQTLAQKAMREGEPADRAEFYRKRGVVARATGDLRAAAESFIIALEIRPDNQAALDDLGDLASSDPDCYDFTATYRELEKIYRRQDNSGPLLARVLTAQARILSRAGDLDQAERIFADGLALVPGDFSILLFSVGLHVSMRRWAQAASMLLAFLERKPPPPEDVRVRALLRLAEIYSDGEMDAQRAASVLSEVLRIAPQDHEAMYQLAQELFILERYVEARTYIERVIELAAAPGSPVSPEALARFYYYYGRILEQLGETRAAGTQYRRAADYDPGYAPPALALAKRAAQAGDRQAAENHLLQAAHVAMERGGPRGAVPLQRGLARILLASGDRVAAIEAYRGILAVEPESGEDRVALAEIYAMEDLSKAVMELYRVLERDLRHAPAYRLMVSLFERMGEPERALRVASILELLGYSDESERTALRQARARFGLVQRRGSLSDELRTNLLLPPSARSVLTDIYQLVAEQVASLFHLPPPGTNFVPFEQEDDPSLKLAVTDCSRLFGVSPEVYIADQVQGGIVALLYPRPIVVLSRDLAQGADAERRFLLGRAMDSIRGLYAPLVRLGPRERSEVGKLIHALAFPDAERPPQAREFVQQLPKRTIKSLERFAGNGAGLDPQAWIQGLGLAQDRAALLSCDDFGAAARALCRLNGEKLAVSSEGAAALGAVPGGVELVRYFLSDDYHRLRQALPHGQGQGQA